MSALIGTESIINPLQESALSKKSLCDYVINVASGCLHGCTFYYVPSTPAIRARQPALQSQGVEDPQMDWGRYLLVREQIPEKLEVLLSRKRTWKETIAGRGVVLLCSGTDPYQNKTTAAITREVVTILLKYGKRVRILTRSPLWLQDLDILIHPSVTVGMSLPHFDDSLSRQIEPHAPLPSDRYSALLQGAKQGCRLYIAMAPTPPQMKLSDFEVHLDRLVQVHPEVIFWEPINGRGTNGRRMAEAGLNFAKSVTTKSEWAACFLRQWHDVEKAADSVGCRDCLHIWADAELEGYTDRSLLESWWHRPTIEQWQN